MKSKAEVKQPGRPVKRPKLEPGEIIMPERLLMPELKKILKSCGAPESWNEEIAEFLFYCSWMPGSYLGAPPLPSNPPAGSKLVRLRKSDISVRERVRPLHLKLFGELYAQAPDVFLDCVSKIRALIKRSLNSPRFQVAAELAMRADDERLSNTNVYSLADGMKKLLGANSGVTTTTVEKAREKLSKAT